MLVIDGYTLDTVRDLFAHTTPDMPPDAWWMAALTLLVLGAAATVDTFTSTVPDPLIFLGLLAVTATQGLYVSWPFAASHLSWALGAALTLWAVNQAWYLLFKHDALGMGDAKWTMLATSCFGIGPALFAWGCGAVLAVLWMGVIRLARYQIGRVYFAPFLFMGLALGLYWFRTVR